MCLDRSFAFSKTITRQMAAAESTFAHAAWTMHFPHAGLQTKAGDVLLALVTKDVIHSGP